MFGHSINNTIFPWASISLTAYDTGKSSRLLHTISIQINFYHATKTWEIDMLLNRVHPPIHEPFL